MTSAVSDDLSPTQQIVGNVLAGILVIGCLWLMVRTIVRIRRDDGLASTRGFLWLLAVLFGNLFGVFLYYYFRERVEHVFDSMFERR